MTGSSKCTTPLKERFFSRREMLPAYAYSCSSLKEIFSRGEILPNVHLSQRFFSRREMLGAGANQVDPLVLGAPLA